jgi:dienelactone hydrolase
MDGGVRMHWLDRAFGIVLGRSLLFSDGWGDPDMLAILTKPEPTEIASPPIEIRWSPPIVRRGIERRRGVFSSPAADILEAEETRAARIEILVPAREGGAADEPAIRPDLAMCVHLASSGEEGFLRRRYFALPLVKKGIGAVILENPYYGARRPKGQSMYFVRRVTDQLAMNRATVRESKAILRWLRARGAEHLAVSGYSMGGFMAALTATRCDFPVAVIPCATGLSPASVFTEGALSRSVHWRSLGREAGGETGARDRLGRILEEVGSYLATARRPKVAIIVAARDDGFVLAREVEALKRVWPEAELRWVDGGHVSAYVRHRQTMRRAILDALERLRRSPS